MRIACLGWGSLIWNPCGLHVERGTNAWHPDGPELPVEFARESSCNRLTLVLLPEGKRVATLWAEMLDGGLKDARSNLAHREKANVVRIGVWPSDRRYLHKATIGSWANERGFDAVVWTALAPKFDNENGTIPSVSQVITYLWGLVYRERSARAQEYIRKAPAQIATPYRAIIEAELGWTPEAAL
jgi:hypothetical protein